MNEKHGLTVPEWVLINWLKIPKMTQNYLSKLSAQAQKFETSIYKKLHWASVVRAHTYLCASLKQKSSKFFNLTEPNIFLVDQIFFWLTKFLYGIPKFFLVDQKKWEIDQTIGIPKRLTKIHGRLYYPRTNNKS